QCAVSMALVLGIVAPNENIRAQMVKVLEQYDYRFHIGMLGMQYLFPALDLLGMHEEAVRLLTAKGYPSYREWFDGGATTMYERWHDDESRNHHMYSCPVAWLHNTLLGIRQDVSLYTKHEITLTPCMIGALTHAEGEYMTDAGKFAVAWRRNGETVTLDVTIPAGITATITPRLAHFADGASVTVMGGRHSFTLIAE
ncbi:MAG: hypothetical protein E7632_10505, partial [Ruminococcaceae bacterium]|nr:hypothetical protein [Oscillospiraceae bacterium]